MTYQICPSEILNWIESKERLAIADGFYMAPTLIKNVDPRDEISTTELFGPVAFTPAQCKKDRRMGCLRRPVSSA